MLLKLFIDGNILIVRHDIHDIPDVGSGLDIIGGIVPASVHFQCVCSGITDKHRIIQITLIHIHKRTAFLSHLLLFGSLSIRFHQRLLFHRFLCPFFEDVRPLGFSHIIFIGFYHTLTAKIGTADEAADDQKHCHRIFFHPTDKTTHLLHLLKSEI